MSWAELGTALRERLSAAGDHTRRALAAALNLMVHATRQTATLADEGIKSLRGLGSKPGYYGADWAQSAVGAEGFAYGTSGYAPRTFGALLARHPLLSAFIISLLVHLTLYGTYQWGKRLGWWDHQATWLLNLTKRAKPALTADQLQKLLAAKQKEMQQAIPMSFADVDPAIAVAEPPKDAKFYGAQNSKAANPEATLDTTVPKIDGKQDKVMRLQDVDKPKPQPLQPSLPPEPASAPKPRETPTESGSGDAVKLVPDRPRTLAEARQRKGLVGQTIRQDGGVRSRGHLSLDVKATPFGAYDSALIDAVQTRWYELIDNARIAPRSGKVGIEFRLHYDGRVTDLKMTDNEVGEILGILCRRAIQDPSPFPRWPSDMRRAVGRDYRDVIFTFYYN